MKSAFVSETLAKIEQALKSETFIDLETAKLELKDLSSGNEWTSLKESICAFLNTEGGFAFCGVRERDKRYILKGFNRNNEKNIIDLQRSTFQDEQGLFPDLSDYIHFDYFELQGLDILVIAVYPLSDDLKYLHFKGEYFERKLTQDKAIPPAKLQKQKEYKQELEYAKELSLVPNAELQDLSLDKINRYIDLINREIRKETLKPSLNKAKEFLGKQHFIRANQVSTLGLLVCGEDPFHFLAERVEVNCYYDTNSDIGKDKKIFRNDVINLMEDTFRYIWGHIKINRSIREGGISEPEYPEKLIRETINNALAHRDYTIARFISISVEPNLYLEIKNPGSFKEKMRLVDDQATVPIRRLIPGIPESKNPKLASVLKVFDKIESQGRGMAALVNAALDNLVDLPYYEIRQDTVTLRIPTGRLVDEHIETWLSGFNKYILRQLQGRLSAEHKAILAYFYKSEQLNRRRYYTILLSESNNHFSVIEDLAQAKLIELHPISDEENVVYVLNPVLRKTEFKTELIELIGQDFIYFDEVAQQILHLCYLYTLYNEQGLKASELSPEIYRRLHGKTIEAKVYETLGRKIRRLCNELQDQGILIRDERQAYRFKFEEGMPGLFDETN